MTSLTALTLIFSTSMITATAAEKQKPSIEKTAAPTVENKTENKSVETTINLYESPNVNSKIEKKLPVNTDLIAIYHQDNWVKVGDREDGSTGWIHLPQYRAAKHDFYRDYFHSNMSSIYMSTMKDKNGKTIIEAYRNGKKLSDADAKKMYDDMQIQERKQWQAMQRFNQDMDQQLLDEQRFMNSTFISPAFMMPGFVVIEQQPTQVSENNEKKATEKK